MADGRPYTVILTGTDPDSRRGGIGFALPGYLAALRAAAVPFESLPTYHPTAPGGRWRPWLAALPALVHRIRAHRRAGVVPLVYSHAGGGVSLLREGIVLRVARLAGARTAIQLHAVTVDAYLRRPLQRALLRVALAGAHTLFVLTPWWERRLREAGIRTPIAVIPNPLPPELEAQAEKLPAHERGGEGMTVLALTRLAPGKGIDAVIAALAELPGDVRLVVAGDGPQRTELEALARRLGVADRVTFTGWVEGAAKTAAFDRADVFCLPSGYDSFGMGFVEAMAHGLPVVALDWGPIGDVVPDGEAGVLVRAPTGPAVAAALQRLADPAARARMGEAGRRHVLARFAPAVVGRALRDALGALAAAAV